MVFQTLFGGLVMGRPHLGGWGRYRSLRPTIHDLLKGLIMMLNVSDVISRISCCEIWGRSLGRKPVRFWGPFFGTRRVVEAVNGLDRVIKLLNFVFQCLFRWLELMKFVIFRFVNHHFVILWKSLVWCHSFVNWLLLDFLVEYDWLFPLLTWLWVIITF